MKFLYKVILIMFLIVGLFFIISAIYMIINNQSSKTERVYTNATITAIIDNGTKDSESNQPNYDVYVQFEHETQIIEVKLNTYSSKYQEGDIIEIYYFPNDLVIAYSPVTDKIPLIYIFIGLLTSICSIYAIYKNKKALSK